MRRSRALRYPAIVALSLALASCAGSCRACLFGVTIAKDDGPPRASLVYTEHLTGGKAPGALPQGRLHIETTPERDVVICEDEPKTGAVVVEPGGKRIAARCNQAPWKVVELGGDDRTFVFCNVDGDPTKDWKSAPTIERHGADVLLCGTTMKSLLDELRARKVSDRALADTMFQASAYPASGTTDRGAVIGGWISEWESLTPAVRKRVDAQLCPKLVEAEADLNVNVADVAIRVCPLDDDRTIDVLLAHAQELAKNGAALNMYPVLWTWSVLGAARAKPAEIGAAVCASVARDSDFGIAIRAYTKTTCEEAAEKQPATCDALDASIDALLAAKPPRAPQPDLGQCETADE